MLYRNKNEKVKPYFGVQQPKKITLTDTMRHDGYWWIKNLLCAFMLISRELWYPSANIRGHEWHLLPDFYTDNLPTCLLRIIVRYMQWLSVSLAEHGSILAFRHWRLYRVYGCTPWRNTMDSTRDSSVVSPCHRRRTKSGTTDHGINVHNS